MPIIILGCLFFGILLVFCFADIMESMPEVILEVLNPRAEIEPPKSIGISSRLSDLSGKTIGLYDIGKEGFANFLDVIEKLLKEKDPTITINRYQGAFDLGEQLALQIAKKVDAVIYGPGD